MLLEHKNLFGMVLVMVLLVNTISADLTFQQDRDVDIKVVCINAGFCTPSAECNLSVFDPAEIILLDGISATRASTGAFYNFTVNNTQTNVLGTYRVGGFCKDGSVTQLIDFTFDITADGKVFHIFPTQFGVILFAFLLVGLGVFQEKLRLFKHLGSILMMIMGVLTLFPGYAFINWTTLMGKAIGFSLIGLGVYFLIEDSFSRDTQEESGLTASPKEFFRGDHSDGRFHH